VRNMTTSAKGTVAGPSQTVQQMAGLNRAVLDQGWGAFGRFLGYKPPERGGKMVGVSRRYSSQTCPVCGVVDTGSHRAQAQFVCVGRGQETDAEEGYPGKWPAEAGSSWGAA
jgi:putative transposase